jgi:hypothetical protein
MYSAGMGVCSCASGGMQHTAIDIRILVLIGAVSQWMGLTLAAVEAAVKDGSTYDSAALK